MCGGKDRFRFDDKEGHGTWICTHCGAGDGFSLLMKVMGIDFKKDPINHPPHYTYC
jgi:putative DNA primase/helicase